MAKNIRLPIRHAFPSTARILLCHCSPLSNRRHP